MDTQGLDSELDMQRRGVVWGSTKRVPQSMIQYVKMHKELSRETGINTAARPSQFPGKTTRVVGAFALARFLTADHKGGCERKCPVSRSLI